VSLGNQSWPLKSEYGDPGSTSRNENVFKKNACDEGRSAPALLGEFLIEVRAIGQDHVSKEAFVLVVAVGLDRDVFPEGEC